MTTVNLTKPITITTTAQVAKETTTEYASVEYLGVADSNELKTVVCFYKIGPHRRDVTLWSGDAYDAAGQYTDEQAQARLAELLNA